MVIIMLIGSKPVNLIFVLTSPLNPCSGNAPFSEFHQNLRSGIPYTDLIQCVVNKMERSWAGGGLLG